jgi:hypothetical protein
MEILLYISVIVLLLGIVYAFSFLIDYFIQEDEPWK